jgi:hypothetical protein
VKKEISFATVIIAISSVGWAAPPDENVIKSCLQGQASDPSVIVRNIDVHAYTEENDYTPGFDATYMFKYNGADAGYAEGKVDKALIYSGKLYPLSKAIPVGDNHGIAPSAFNPNLAVWSVVREGNQRYFCVGFNFDGLGRSGAFQNVHGGYLLTSKTRVLYFAVRDVRQ